MDITIVPKDFIITHKKTDFIMDISQDGKVIYAVEKVYHLLTRCNDCKYNENGYCTMWFTKIDNDGFCYKGEKDGED